MSAHNCPACGSVTYVDTSAFSPSWGLEGLSDEELERTIEGLEALRDTTGLYDEQHAVIDKFSAALEARKGQEE